MVLYTDILLGHMLLSDCDSIFIMTYYSIYCHDRWRCLRALNWVFNQGPDVKIINVCIWTGHVLHCWQAAVNTMIFKDPSNFRIHRLRVLHIYEADLNLILTVKWRDLLWSAEIHGQVNMNQHGAWPGCKASSLALSKELCKDIAYSTQRTLVSVDNNASDCFDRMNPTLVSLAKLHGFGRHNTLCALLEAYQTVSIATAMNFPFMGQAKDLVTLQSFGCCCRQHYLTPILRWPMELLFKIPQARYTLGVD
jgi:hypothetical protein